MVPVRWRLRSLLFIVCLLAQIASASEAPEFSEVIRAARSTLLPYEPLVFSITAPNLSSVAATIMCCGIGIEVLNDAAVALGAYYIKGVGGSPDLPQAKRIFHELETKAETAPTAAYYLGVIAMQEGDLSVAKRYIVSAQQTSPNPPIQQQAKYRLFDIARKQRD
jgi:TPR repeat protein